MVDDQMLPRDPALPQLQIAWNPELMLEVFRHTLKPFAGIDYCTAISLIAGFHDLGIARYRGV